MYRKAGILMPIFSLPSKYGIGSLGQKAFEFVDFLSKSKMSIWQILPLSLTSFGNSPYQSPSSSGLNYYFIDLDILNKKGLLEKEEYEYIDFGDDKRVDYGKIFNNRVKILKKAFNRFNKEDKKFQEFINTQQKYRDFAFFMVLKDLNNLQAWYIWDDEYKHYSKKLENRIIKEHNDEFLFYLWTQYEFLNQYVDLKRYANSKGVSIMGDIPIYVAYDSVDVYKYPKNFELNENKEPINVAGCPPDCFSDDGQLWGNPLYNWTYLKRNKYQWWNQRILDALNLFDIVRIDHFRGFAAYYSIPYKDTTAKYGKWVDGPGFNFFKDKLKMPIVAEDLGFIDDKFRKLMKQTKYPGMKIISFGLDDASDLKNMWKPSNFTRNYFSYPASHDSPTTMQYLEELDEVRLENVKKVIERECRLLKVDFNKEKEISLEYLEDKIIEINLASKSKAAICLIQDLLHIGKEGRLNYPSSLSDDNWSWRLTDEQFDLIKANLEEKLSYLVEKYNRKRV